MRQHYWEKWSDSDPLMWSVWPENNPKIKHNMKLYSSYLHKTNAKKKKKIESSQSQKLDYWLWQSFLHLFVPIKLLELNWERQTKEKKMLSSWNPSLLEPKATSPPGWDPPLSSIPALRCCGCCSQVSGRDIQVAGHQQPWAREKGHAFPLPRARWASPHQG